MYFVFETLSREFRAMLIPKCVFGVGKACDIGSSRFSLGAVHLERDNHGILHAVATDGRRLVEVSWDDQYERTDYPAEVGQVDGVCQFETLISQADWKEIEQMAGKAEKESKHKPVLQRVLLDEQNANGKVALGTTNGSKVCKIEVEPAEGRFPKWREVIPEYTTITDGDLNACHDALKSLLEWLGDAELPESVREKVETAISAGRIKGPAVSIKLDHKFLCECTEIVAKTSDADDENRSVELIVPIPERMPGRDDCSQGPALVKSTKSGAPQSKAVIMPLSV